ncbi:MAG: D-alanyl-D-alanine carboxypeptidase family protein [Ruminococcus sp.]|nr:D-alanyl-D-alanine carboxypeptidase family protein [Ruminococcus sp.]
MAVKTVRRYKYKNIAIAMAIILLILLSISTACSKNGSSKTKDSSSSIAENESSSTTEKNQLTSNFRYISIKNEDALGKGVLTLIDSKNKYTGGTPANLVGVYNYLFNKSEEQIMSASSTDVKGEEALLEALNSMMSDFYSKTKLSNVIVNTIYYSANADSEKSEENNTNITEYSKEHETGYAFDLNTYTADTGSYPDFTGEGKYKWILENCHKYGIVQRYTEEKADVTGVKAQTNHFRYVGKPNAEIMKKNNLCLEEYIDYIKGYSFEKPLIFESDEKLTYAVYYVAADNAKTTNLPIPLKENDTEYPYEYSGNNKDGYIIWIITEDNSNLLKTDSSSVFDSSTDNSNDSSKTEDSKSESKTESSKNDESKPASSDNKSSKSDSSQKSDSSKTNSSKSDSSDNASR